MYILNKDLQNHENEHSYKVITDYGNPTILTFAKSAATEQARSYIKSRYDHEKEFAPITEWSNTVAYLEGARVYKEDQQTGDVTLFIALNDHNGVDPESQGQTDWKEGDNRNPWLLMIVLDLCIHHMYKKIPNRKSPQEVNDRYIDAMDWLKGVASGEINPDLPAIPEDDDRDTTFPQFGGHPRIGNDW